MKDQNPVDEFESQRDKWERGRSLFIESLHKPDHALRGCAHNQKCYNELIEVREMAIEWARSLPNPREN